MSQVEPGWHAWLGELVDTPPNRTKIENLTVRAYPTVTERYWNFTGTNGAYKPYNTTKDKVTPWQPKVVERE